MKAHVVKTLPCYYVLAMRGEKTFEVRSNDRDYREGDLILLACWSDDDVCYTGEVLVFFIGPVTDLGPIGLTGYVGFSLVEIASCSKKSF